MALVDLALGVFAYLVISLILRHPWSWSGLLVAEIAAVFPDLDFAVFMALEGKFPQLISHRQVGHFPVWYAIVLGPVCMLLWYGRIVAAYYIALVVMGITIHFLHDLVGPAGDPMAGLSLRPLSSKRLVLWTTKASPWDYEARKTRMRSQSYFAKFLEQVWRRAFRMSRVETSVSWLAILSLIAFYISNV